MPLISTNDDVFRSEEVDRLAIYYNALPLVLLLCSIGIGSMGCSQDAASSPDDPAEPKMLRLDEFRPQPMLNVAASGIDHASFPVVDVHTHFGHRLRGSEEQRDGFVQLMDRHGIALCVSLDGTLPDGFETQRRFLWETYPDRFVIFANLDFQGGGDAGRPETWACNQPGFVRHAVMLIEQAADQGASGLKFFKQFGLGYKKPDGSLHQIDDPRWDPIWQVCARRKLPVLMHVADPAAFFLPIDEHNERYEELARHPDWSFHGPEFPSREALLAARNRVIARHPETIFIGAHLANNPEDLAEVARWLEQYPNLYVEFASRIAELGRQPYTARKFLIDHADRVLFGTDGPWPEQRVRLYWRFLETYDEYFPYSEKEFPPQGFWNIYGVGLPEDVLRKIYHENAARIIPGVAERLARLRPTPQ